MPDLFAALLPTRDPLPPVGSVVLERGNRHVVRAHRGGLLVVRSTGGVISTLSPAAWSALARRGRLVRPGAPDAVLLAAVAAVGAR